jgi:hypothetical protein
MRLQAVKQQALFNALASSTCRTSTRRNSQERSNRQVTDRGIGGKPCAAGGRYGVRSRSMVGLAHRQRLAEMLDRA